MPQRVIRHPRSLQLHRAQVAVHDVAHAAAAQATQARDVPVGHQQKLAEGFD
jgi:hypothetical protein